MAASPDQRSTRVFRRASWSIVDQGLSALSNLLLSVIVARTLGASDFGAFAVAFLTFGLLVGVTRAMVGQPLQITFSSAEPADHLAAVRSALGASLLIGCVFGTVVALVGFALTGDTGRAMLALGVCLPGLLVQDTARMAFFSSGRADRAALNDGLWTVLEFAALAVLLLTGVRDVVAFIAVWGGGALVAAIVAVLVLRAPPLLRGALRWLAEQRQLTGYLLAERFLGEGLSQIGILMVGIAASTADVGSMRAGQVLLGPLNILVTAALLFGIPEVSRRRTSMSARQRQRLCWSMSAAMLVVTLTYAAVTLLLPDAVGVQLLGETWSGAQTVLPALCVFSLAIAAGVGPGVLLYGLGQARTTFGLNLLKAPILLVLLTLGVWSAGAVGAAWALAGTESALLPFIFVKALRALRLPVVSTAATAVVETPGGGTGPDDVLVPSGSHDDAGDQQRNGRL